MQKSMSYNGKVFRLGQWVSFVRGPLQGQTGVIKEFYKGEFNNVSVAVAFTGYNHDLMTSILPTGGIVKTSINSLRSMK